MPPPAYAPRPSGTGFRGVQRSVQRRRRLSLNALPGAAAAAPCAAVRRTRSTTAPVPARRPLGAAAWEAPRSPSAASDTSSSAADAAPAAPSRIPADPAPKPQARRAGGARAPPPPPGPDPGPFRVGFQPESGSFFAAIYEELMRRSGWEACPVLPRYAAKDPNPRLALLLGTKYYVERQVAWRAALEGGAPFPPMSASPRRPSALFQTDVS